MTSRILERSERWPVAEMARTRPPCALAGSVASTAVGDTGVAGTVTSSR